jgi:hypothetical protein
MDSLKDEERTIILKRLTMAELAKIHKRVPRPQINIETRRSLINNFLVKHNLNHLSLRKSWQDSQKETKS